MGVVFTLFLVDITRYKTRCRKILHGAQLKMNATYFTVELWYRGKLQFVRVLENFDMLTDLNYRVGTLKELSTGWEGDGEAFFYQRGVSTFKDLLCVKPYPHKDKIANKSRYSRTEPFLTEGYPELIRLIMSL
jgi:hypothetical protein